MQELTEEVRDIETKLEYVNEVGVGSTERKRTAKEKHQTLQNYLGVDDKPKR